jgi:hypothetical protein
LKTFETVPRDTPAAFPTSSSVGIEEPFQGHLIQFLERSKFFVDRVREKQDVALERSKARLFLLSVPEIPLTGHCVGSAGACPNRFLGGHHADHRYYPIIPRWTQL